MQLLKKKQEVAKPGRPKTDKNGLQELASKMIEEGTLFGFDDDKELDEYTTKDFRELFEANFQEREAKIRQDTPKEFFESLAFRTSGSCKICCRWWTRLKRII